MRTKNELYTHWLNLSMIVCIKCRKKKFWTKVFETIISFFEILFLNDSLNKQFLVIDEQFNNHRNFCHQVKLYFTLQYVIKYIDIELFRYALKRVIVIFQNSKTFKYAQKLFWIIHICDISTTIIKLQKNYFFERFCEFTWEFKLEFRIESFFEIVKQLIQNLLKWSFLFFKEQWHFFCELIFQQFLFSQFQNYFRVNIWWFQQLTSSFENYFKKCMTNDESIVTKIINLLWCCWSLS